MNTSSLGVREEWSELFTLAMKLYASVLLLLLLRQACPNTLSFSQHDDPE